MTKLIWDDSLSKTYEAGVDRGVIRSKSGLIIPWNGVVSVEELPDLAEVSETYFDGKKIENRANRTYYACQITGYQLPSEFDSDHQILWDAIQELVGEARVRGGLYLTSQKKREFDFSYRTQINDTDYKIHLVWDATITKATTSYVTLTDTVKVTEYKWSIYTVPPRTFDLSAFTDQLIPTAHFIVDSRQANPTKLALFEDMLYGTEETFPNFPTQEQVVTLFTQP